MLPSTAARDATGVFVLRLGCLLQPQQMIFVLLILLMVLILMPRGSSSLLPLPSRQKKTTSCLQRKSHLSRESRGRLALNIIQSPAELFTIFFPMPETSLEMSLIVIFLNRCPATCRKMKPPMAFAMS